MTYAEYRQAMNKLMDEMTALKRRYAIAVLAHYDADKPHSLAAWARDHDINQGWLQQLVLRRTRKRQRAWTMTQQDAHETPME